MRICMPPPPLVSRLSGSACETIQLATRSLSGSTSSRYLLEISGDCRVEITAVAIALAVALSGTAAPNGDKHSACAAFAQKGDASSATARKEVFIAGIVRRNANVRKWVGRRHSIRMAPPCQSPAQYQLPLRARSVLRPPLISTAISLADSQFEKRQCVRAHSPVIASVEGAVASLRERERSGRR